MRSLFLALVFVVLSAAATPAKECTVGQYEADKERMIAATKAGTLKADPASGREGIALSVFISEAFWYRMTFLEKIDFAESLVCATAGVGKGILVLHLRSDMTGEVIGEWRINQLTVPSTTPRPSVEGGGTPKQTGFSCNPNEKVCRCDGGPEGADCIAMRKICSGDLQCIVSGGTSSCACRMEITPQEGASVIKPPMQTTTPPKSAPAPSSSGATGNSEEPEMSYWALITALATLVAGLIGFGGSASAVTGLARILFFVFLVVFLGMLIL